jgi:Ca-activated chloride channel homolog
MHPIRSLSFHLQIVILLALTIPAAAQQNSPVTPASPAPAQSSSPAQSTPANNAQQPSAQPPDSQPPLSSDQSGMFVFKKQVDEVVLHATVVDERQRLETHLDRGAFAVFEDGLPQTITSFRIEDVPVAMGILIDNSSSMRDKRSKVNQAVLNLIRASNPQDEIFVVNFGETPFLDQDFTSNIGLLEQALHRTSTQGSTALYDAIIAADAHLDTNSRLNKKVLLVITDGQDNMSVATLQQTIRRLQRRNGPTLYAIGLMGTGPQGGRQALQSFADATGGSAFFPDALDQVDDTTRSLAHDVRSQYTIAYKPKDQSRNSSYHPIVVEARAPGYGRLTVRTRNGYYAGESLQ